MTVVSNASPLNYLVLISALDLLPQLFGAVFIPSAMRDELSDSGALEIVQFWIEKQADWLHIHEVNSKLIFQQL